MKRRGNKIEEEKEEEKEEEGEEGEEVSVIPQLSSLSLSFFPVLFLEGELYRGKGDVRRGRSIQLLADAISVGGKSNTPSSSLKEKWNVESKKERGVTLMESRKITVPRRFND